MKSPLKIIKYRDGTYGAKKKGLFGWKYWNEGDSGYSWSYGVPLHMADTKFKNKKEVLLALIKYYHGDRMLLEVKE